ncbi:hypothetical protein BOTBODRAFT_48962 [Botryobasidium botryosum FD-172 SS1]|uniref:Uncharacterized protein n=1 Tax=Botryobasidium botryosum (strain FD-172 SS1) TaxID=930990 RepID=A0A067LUV8_BOTB1|nr:hypothetical protein BOTBODRAFT_48962 [Botryobasidium botryosum FD-172 SS1]
MRKSWRAANVKEILYLHLSVRQHKSGLTGDDDLEDKASLALERTVVLEVEGGHPTFDATVFSSRAPSWAWKRTAHNSSAKIANIGVASIAASALWACSSGAFVVTCNDEPLSVVCEDEFGPRPRD